MSVRVAVIGAGCAGLAMCRALINEPKIEYIVYEKTKNIGGLWVYTKSMKQNTNIQTALYKNLRSNLPKEVMAYPDLQFPNETIKSFVHHEVVLDYLKSYVNHFNLDKKIKLEHEVQSVKPIHNKSGMTWQVMINDIKNEEQYVEMFDAVVVCSGHFSEPNIPDIPGMDVFPGITMHSISYDSPEQFQDKTVVILGGKTSAMDISTEVSKFAKKVYLVHQGEKVCENVEEIFGTLTRAFDDSSVEINNEHRKFADAVIFCTGYHYTFPFLDPECNIKVVNNCVTSLYKHVFNITYPSLSFVGLHKQILPCPYFYVQSHWITSILAGRKSLPNSTEMMMDNQHEYETRLKSGLREKDMHQLGVKRFQSYCNEISQVAGIDNLPPYYFSIYNHCSENRANHYSAFRETTYRITQDNQDFIFFNEIMKK